MRNYLKTKIKKTMRTYSATFETSSSARFRLQYVEKNKLDGIKKAQQIAKQTGTTLRSIWERRKGEFVKI